MYRSLWAFWLNCFVLFQDISLSTEATLENFKTTLSYERQVWILEGALRDESHHSSVQYSSFIRLASPTNLVDIQVLSNAVVAAETTSGGLELKYMTSRDRQFKTLALTAEINRLRNELKLQVGSECVVTVILLLWQKWTVLVVWVITDLLQIDINSVTVQQMIRQILDHSLIREDGVVLVTLVETVWRQWAVVVLQWWVIVSLCSSYPANSKNIR